MSKKHLIIGVITVLILNIIAGVIITLLEVPRGERWTLNLVSGFIIGVVYVRTYFYYLDRKETRYFKFESMGKVINIFKTRSEALTDLFLNWDMEGLISTEITRKEYKELKKIHG